MKTQGITQICRHAVRALLLGLLLAGPAMAGPGAHGPGGEHLDAPAGVVNGGAPRIEAHSELFELVGQLHAGELSLLIDRYETNEPLLEAHVEVESSGLKAQARFHTDHGDYAVDDERLLALLRRPGEHALVFTIVKGEESDLLDGVLRHGGVAEESGHATGLPSWRWAALVLALALGAGAVWRWQATRRKTVINIGDRT